MNKSIFKSIAYILEMLIYISFGYFMITNLFVISKPPVGASIDSYLCSLLYIVDTILHYILLRKADTKLKKIIIVTSVFSDALFGVLPAIMSISFAEWLCFFLVALPVLFRIVMQIVLLTNPQSREIFKMKADEWRWLILCFFTCLTPLAERILGGGSAFLAVVATGILLTVFINKHIINRVWESRNYLACYSQCCILIAIPTIYIAIGEIIYVEAASVSNYFRLIAGVLILFMGGFELVKFLGKENTERQDGI